MNLHQSALVGLGLSIAWEGWTVASLRLGRPEYSGVKSKERVWIPLAWVAATTLLVFASR